MTDNRLKRLLISLFCGIWMLCCAAPALAEEGGDALIVGVFANRCPVFYMDADTDELVGIGVDLMRFAAREAGYSASFKVIEEETLKDALDSDAYDVLLPFGSAIASTSGRPSVVSDNLIQTPFTLVTEGSHGVSSFNELKVGMLFSLAAGAETVRQLYPGIEIVMYDDMPEAVRALRAGEVDALLHNSYVWSYVLQKPSYADLQVQPSAMFSMDFRAGAPDTPEGRAIIERLNGGIAALTDTQRQAITLDYTSRRLYRYDFSDYARQYGLILLLGALLFASLIVTVVEKQRAMRLEQEEKVRRLIDQDPLTGALSLAGFRKRVEELLRAHPDVPYLLSFNNIKNFKYINDSLGRSAGDDLLRFWVAKSMEVLSDEEAMGRIAADRFAVLRRTESEERIQEDIANVGDPVRNYFIDRGKKTRVQICSGVYALTAEDYQHIDVDHMLDYARVAEKRLRSAHREGYEFYNREQWEKGKRIADVVSNLQLAIDSGALQVWYQPQVNYDTGKITGAEALARWNHDKLGWISPSEFIPTLEEAGLIYELDRFVWETVCRDLRRWNEQGRRASVSVNLSRCDMLESRDIPGIFEQLIQTYGLGADQLRIEITETAYVEDPALLIRTTLKLRQLGFQVEMDDFGSGYSSLHMLKEVPVDRIKLDLLFLSESGDAARSRIIVSQMNQMVQALGMELLAEGVETVEQARFLHGIGCHEMQGFYFYKPMTVREFEALGEDIAEED